ncbi:MAG: alpha/beta hydrolase [Pyrinomonadaceae bacterium]
MLRQSVKLIAILILLIVSLFSSLSNIPTAQVLTGRTQDASANNQNLEGIWQGAIEANAGIRLRLVLKISKSADGAFKGTLDSIDQSANNLPIDTIDFKDAALHFEMKMISGTYDGKMSADGTQIDGQWRQGSASFPLLFRRTEKALTLVRPQEPKKPYPYDEREVSYENKQDKIKIAGTLTLPRVGSGPFPAALLITGSGPQDRDEALLGHKPFLVLADYLTRRGIAVLRVDDRGVGGTSRGGPNDTDENYVEDALAGIEFLMQQKEINAKQIGLIGHSEGGIIAPMVAARSADVAFVVLMAGPGVPGKKLLLMQSDLLLRAEMEKEVDSSVEATERMFKIALDEKDPTLARKLMSAEQDRVITEQKKKVEQLQSLLQAQTAMMLTPWFRYILNYDPRPTLMKVQVPVLAINGERDLQVPAKEDLAGIEEALKAGGNRNFKTVMLPNLNHLFQTSETGAPSEYGDIEETIAPIALQTIGDWIVAHTKKQ